MYSSQRTRNQMTTFKNLKFCRNDGYCIQLDCLYLNVPFKNFEFLFCFHYKANSNRYNIE